MEVDAAHAPPVFSRSDVSSRGTSGQKPWGDTGRWHLPASPRTTVLRCQWGSSSFVKREGLILQMNADGLMPTTSWDVSLVSHESLEELRLGSPEGELFSATLAGTWAVSIEGSEVDCCKRHQPPHCPEM